MGTKQNFALSLLVILLLTACGQQPPSGPGTAEVLIPPTTKVLEPTDRQGLLEVRADGTMVFSAASGIANRLEADDVVVSEPASAAPMGLLRKVTSVREAGDVVIVTTVGAELREAVHEGSLSVTLDLDEADLEGSLALRSGVAVQGLGHTIDTDFGTGGRLQVTGSLDIDPILDLDIGISCSRKVLGICIAIPDLNVLVKVGFEETADLSIVGSENFDFDEEFAIARHDFKPVTFSIGPIPVVLTPRLDLFLTTSGSLTGDLSFTADQSLTLAGGFSFDSDTGFDDIVQNESSFDHGNVAFDGEASARASVGGRFQIRLYGVVGPFGSLEGGPRLEGSHQGLTGPGTVLWTLEGCLTGTVGIDSVDVLNLQYSTELFDACATFANHENQAPSVFILAPVEGSQRFVGEDVTLRASTSDPDGHAVACEWTSSVADASFPVSGCETSVVFATAGSRTLTLTGTDPAGATDSDTVTITVDPAPDILVTISNPEEGRGIPIDEPTTLQGSASGGVEPYTFSWSVAPHPTSEEIHQIGPGASRDWTPNETFEQLDELCAVMFPRLILDVIDADGFEGTRTIDIMVGGIC